MKNDEAVCDSLIIADRFHKRHDKLVSEIDRMYGDLVVVGYAQNSGHPIFVKTSYKHPQNGQIYQKYLMNRDGFSLLVMGFTGKKALEWKLKYIGAFNEMEKFILEKQSHTWIETRHQGKLTRSSETDVIKQLVEYAKEQGSSNSDKLYMTYSKLANKMAGVKNRDESSVMQLNNLSLIENIILNCVKTGIAMNKHYKDIYQDCKRRLEVFKDLAYLETAI